MHECSFYVLVFASSVFGVDPAGDLLVNPAEAEVHCKPLPCVYADATTPNANGATPLSVVKRYARAPYGAAARSQGV